MRTLIKFSFVITLLALVASCGSDKGKKAETKDAVGTKAAAPAAAKSYNLAQGTVTWVGSKVAYDHSGTINVSAGTLSAEGNMVKSGEFTIDMASLKNTDLAADAEKQGKLEGHLKSGDFFDVEKFPTATFIITSVAAASSNDSNCNITGDLTMKGKTKSITFPALVVAGSDGTLTAVSNKFSINRNDWDVQYGSGLSGAIGDNIISDNVGLQIELKAK